MPSEWPRPELAGAIRGDAVTLWRLRHESGNLHCFVVEWPGAYWLGVECAGGELVMSETVVAIGDVVNRAAAIKSPLIAEGWREE